MVWVKAILFLTGILITTAGFMLELIAAWRDTSDQKIEKIRSRLIRRKMRSALIWFEHGRLANLPEASLRMIDVATLISRYYCLELFKFFRKIKLVQSINFFGMLIVVCIFLSILSFTVSVFGAMLGYDIPTAYALFAAIPEDYGSQPVRFIKASADFIGNTFIYLIGHWWGITLLILFGILFMINIDDGMGCLFGLFVLLLTIYLLFCYIDMTLAVSPAIGISVAMITSLILAVWLGSGEDDDRKADKFSIAAFAFMFSFPLTLIAIAFGAELNGTPRTHSALLILLNLLGDIATLAITLHVIRLIRQNPSVKNTVKLIGLDLLAASTLAIFCIYIGLLPEPEHRLSLIQCCYILVGLSPNSPHQWDFGQLFLVSHTTFIPTVLVLMMIAISVLIRAWFAVPASKAMDIILRGKDPLKRAGVGLMALGVLVTLISAPLVLHELLS